MAFKEEVPVAREFPVFTVNASNNHDEEMLEKSLESSDYSFLFGKTKFGDAIEDEWFIVYLLLQISNNNQEMVISLFDDDGDFLLIEAADYLPPEMQPETMENRVFLCAGQLHLLPLRHKGLAIGKALEVVLDSSIDTMAAPEIQRAALRRALMYPELALTLQHKAKVIVPHLAAHILHTLPAIIAPAVDAFYSRDERTTRVCMEMQKFSSKTMVPMTCTMTRLQYALLKSSEFIPSPKFKIPPTFNTSYVATDLGIKIASGLEILYCNYCDEQGNKRNTKAYAIFKKKLSEMGYFQGEVEGSTLYQKLEKEALDSFTSQAQEHENTYLIPQFLELAKQGEENLVPPSRMCQKQSDSDDWLFLSPDDVDNMVHGDNGQKPLNMEDGFSSDDDDDESSSPSLLESEDEKELQDLDTMVHGVGDFIEKESGFRGALLPNDADSDLESVDSSHSSLSSSSSSDMNPMTFNAEVFLEKLQKCSVSSTSRSRETSSKPELPITLESFMDAMDKELQTETILGDDNFQRDAGGNIDTHANLLKHMIASVEAQQGSSGPASNMIGGLGLKIPRV